MSGDFRIFAGSSGKAFARRMCDYLGVDLGETEVLTFSEGNTYVKIGENVRGKSVYLVQPIGLDANTELVELLFWMDAFKRSGARYVTAVIPYFSYAKGDKKDEPRVSIRARVCAECIELAGADRIITMDLHAAQIQGFFKKPVDHLYARPLLAELVRSLSLSDAVIIAPDAGFAKDARKFSGYLNLPTAIADKSRSGHDEKAEILELMGDVAGRNAIIVDDFSISGGTIVELTKLLKARWAKSVCACLSHLPVSAQGVEAIAGSDVKLVISTDTIENPRVTSDNFRIVSVAPLFAEAISRMSRMEPISDLFDGVPETLLQACIGAH